MTSFYTSDGKIGRQTSDPASQYSTTTPLDPRLPYNFSTNSTVIRVPRTVGCPRQIFGSIVIRSIADILARLFGLESLFL
jgi:hypothetical protein